jgi:hypothetical protein
LANSQKLFVVIKLIKVKFFWCLRSGLLTLCLLSGLLGYGQVVKAQENLSLWGDPTAGEMVGFEAFKVIGLGNRDPRLIITSIVQIALGFLGVLAVLLILYAGWLWMTSNGDERKIDQARDLIKNAVIGLLIILSAFAIVTFILRALIRATGAFGGGGSDEITRNAISLSAMGMGIIGSVYPEPNQLEVARNTSIIVYFKEAVDPATICDQVVDGKCAPEAKILPESVKIFQSNVGDEADSNLTAVRVNSNDNKTFVFAPQTYLGSPTEKLWYTVGLSTKIMKADKKTKAFSVAGFAWQFEVSDVLDLTPPKVVSSGVFPAPDNAQDQPGQITEANFAKGSVVINGQLVAARAWRVSYIKSNPNSPELSIANPKANQCNGQMDIAINGTNPPTANIAYGGLSGLVDEPEAAIIDRKIKTACGLEIGLLKEADNFAVGQSWTLTLATERKADALIVGAAVYNFVDKLTGGRQILIGADAQATAANVVGALAANTEVIARLDDENKAKVNMQAKVPGKIGNNLDLLTTAAKEAVLVSPFGGGSDRLISMKVMDKGDKPRNAIIQVNFDEAINPLSLSGRSELLAKNIAVMNGDEAVSGEFRLSNQYKTVEFVPDEECGMNACGEKIYCLPASSNLRVELKASPLATVCSAEADCVSKTPFNSCDQGICYDQGGQAFYPAGRLGEGIVDLASNSLDGNRDQKAIGPKEAYLENDSSGSGDSFAWTFWTSDVLDVSAPVVTSISPSYNQVGVAASEPIQIRFNKLMLNDSLQPGAKIMTRGDKQIEHQLVNLRSLASSPVGYWLINRNEDSSVVPDGEMDATVVAVNHSLFAPTQKYRVQIGSGVRDIYQNCYKPCAGPNCGADSSNASCCNGEPTDLGTDPMCPD